MNAWAWIQVTLHGHMSRTIAVSPPPITAMGFLRKMGAAPSQTAQAEIPLFQKPLSSPLPGNSRRRATAPVAMMMVSAVTSLSLVQILKGRLLSSTLVTVSVKIVVPILIDCFRMFSTSSEPSSPSGKPARAWTRGEIRHPRYVVTLSRLNQLPGKFSTSVVVVNCPPAAIPLASHPSNRIGWSSARAA